jgi:isoleucyl-tRNA synthetase
MVRWLAPILSFTAEEIWSHLPGERPESVFHTTWAPLPRAGSGATPIDWNALINLRSDVLRELERLRVEGTIGAPLDAAVDVYVSRELAARFSALGDELRFLLITSEARVHVIDGKASVPDGAVPATSAAAEGAWIRVRATTAAKCVRCWHHRDDVASNPEHPEICGRCVLNVDGPGETRSYV